LGKWKERKHEHTFHSSIGNAHKATSVGTLPGVDVERKTKVSAATVGTIECSVVIARVEVRAKVVVVATQQRAQCTVWRPIDA
jgi:hypothetical protein